jgi:hypothetical protein
VQFGFAARYNPLWMACCPDLSQGRILHVDFGVAFYAQNWYPEALDTVTVYHYQMMEVPG